MNYRTIFLEFLANYREYHFDCLQLLLFENNHENNILKVISDSNLVELYQVKGSQVYNKNVNFSSINNTVVNLLFVIEKPEVIEISKADEEIKNYQDLYSSKRLFDLNYKYLIIYPIYQNQQLLGGLFIFSNYQLIWQIEENKMIRFINDLENAKSLDVINDINNQVGTNNWALVKKGVYINDSLAEKLGIDRYHNAFNFKGHSLQLLKSIEYLSGKVNVYNYIPKVPILSAIEFDNLKLRNYSIIYTKPIDKESLDDIVKIVNDIITEIDGSLGYYQIYQTDSNSILILFEEEVNKKTIADYFKNIPYIFIRSNHELKKMVDFSILREYLNLSPLEEFNWDYFAYYEQKLILEKKKNVETIYNSSKIKVTPYFNSINMNIEGYLIKDLYDLKNASNEIKLKSIKAISKIAKEYQNVIISIQLEDMFKVNKPYIAYINSLKRLSVDIRNIKFLVDYDKEKYLLIKAFWPEFEKYIIINEENTSIYDLLMIDEIEMICLDKKKYFELSNRYSNKALELTEFWLNKANKVFIYVNQNDIIKYRDKNLLLILGE